MGIYWTGLAICLLENPKGDYFEMMSFAFCSMSRPINVEILSIPKSSFLLACSSINEDEGFMAEASLANQDFE